MKCMYIIISRAKLNEGLWSILLHDQNGIKPQEHASVCDIWVGYYPNCKQHSYKRGTSELVGKNVVSVYWYVLPLSKLRA